MAGDITGGRDRTWRLWAGRVRELRIPVPAQAGVRTVQDYSGDDTWTRDTSGAAPGAYTVQARVRTLNSWMKYDVSKNQSNVITAP